MLIDDVGCRMIIDRFRDCESPQCTGFFVKLVCDITPPSPREGGLILIPSLGLCGFTRAVAAQGRPWVGGPDGHVPVSPQHRLGDLRFMISPERIPSGLGAQPIHPIYHPPVRYRLAVEACSWRSRPEMDTHICAIQTGQTTSTNNKLRLRGFVTEQLRHMIVPSGWRLMKAV